MIKYYCSDGSRVSQATIDRKLRKAKGEVIINSYKDSMKRKRPQNPAEPLNFLGDQT